MLSTKTLKPLAFTAAVAILVMTGSAHGAEKKRRRIMQNIDDPYLAFVPGQPLLFAAERGRAVLLLHYPDLEISRKLDAPPDRKLDVIKSSPGGTWIAGFFEESSFRQGGTLRVWNLATGESHLVLDDASRAFEFLDDNRLIVWQPKSGITQWGLGEGQGKQVGPVITSATNVQVNVATQGMYFSPDHRYLLVSGSCRGDDPKTDIAEYCLYDTSDGATVGWTAEDPQSMNNPNGGVFSRQFNELLVTTKVDVTGAGPADCKQAGQNRQLCSDPVYVSLIETYVVSEAEKEKARQAAEAPQESRPLKRVPLKDIINEMKERGKAADAEAEASRARRAAIAAASGRRVVWTIRSGDELGGRFINSCAVSADGRWVAIAAQGVTVSLFDTGNLESKSSFLNGAWQEPVMVKQFEMP
jgi:hypothetical protein